MLQAVEFIDVIVPRGGKGLVGLVQAEARVPVFAHLEGICHVYADRDADQKAQGEQLRTGLDPELCQRAENESGVKIVYPCVAQFRTVSPLAAFTPRRTTHRPALPTGV